jgi:hypothetical protein
MYLSLAGCGSFGTTVHMLFSSAAQFASSIEEQGIGIVEQVIPFEFLLFVKALICLEVTAGAQRTQFQYRFRTFESPTRTR